MEGVESSSSVTFELGKPYSQIKEEDEAEEVTVCDKIHDNTLLYRSKVPARGWRIETKTVFTDQGITSYVKNVDKNVTTVKYYTRITDTATSVSSSALSSASGEDVV